jgi:SAM-dependent methyltransferase
MEGYTEDLAYIHDAGFGGFSENAAPGLLDMLRGSGIRDGLVVDLGCGGGHWAHRLAEHGYDVLGIDISPAMVKLARSREPRAKFLSGSFLTARLPRCAAITAISESLGYLFDNRNGERALEKFFARAHRALEPGGLLIFDVLESRPGVLLRNARRWSKGDDWVVLVNVVEDPQARRLTREIVSFRKAGKSYRRTDEVHNVALVDRDVILGGLRRQGFSARVLRGYGELRFANGHIGFVARKK